MVWMVVRDADRSAVQHDVLAACPDSPERGDRWMWSIRRTGQPGHASVEVDADPTLVDATTRWLEGAREVPLVRVSGQELAVVPVHGEHTVRDGDGPWERTLQPGDVFIVEGELDESLLLSSDPTGVVCVITLRPLTDDPLRWVP